MPPFAVRLAGREKQTGCSSEVQQPKSCTSMQNLGKAAFSDGARNLIDTHSCQALHAKVSGLRIRLTRAMWLGVCQSSLLQCYCRQNSMQYTVKTVHNLATTIATTAKLSFDYPITVILKGLKLATSTSRTMVHNKCSWQEANLRSQMQT